MIALAILQGAAAGARAEEWFHFSPLKGEVELGYRGTWNRNESASDNRTRETDARLRLRQAGYILDPRIASFNINLEPTFRRINFSDDFGTRKTDDQLLNYGLSVRALQGTPGPLGFSAGAARNTGTSESGFGSRSDFDIQTRNLTGNWKNSAFPTTLSYNERITDQTLRSGGGTITSERDDTLRTLTLNGRSRKLNVFLERADFDDRIEYRDGDTTTDTARILHTLLWGKGSSLSSNWAYVDRVGGTNPYERFQISEAVSIKNTEDLTTAATYTFENSTFETTGQPTETVRHRGDIRVTHNLYDNLTSSANVLGSLRETEQVTRETQYGGGLDFSYRKGIRWEGVFTAGLGGSYTVTDRETINGLLSVVDEPHFVAVTTPSFLLNQRFIVNSTIVVTDSGTGIPYLLGPDYLVVPVSGDLTEIQIVPGGAIAIAAPTTVLVSYDYQPLPSQELSTTGFNYNLGLDFGWVRVYHRDSGSNEDRISGAPATVLIDRRDTTTGTEFKWTGGRNRASLVAERRYQMIGERETETYSFRQFLYYGVARDTLLTASASQDFIDSDGTKTDLYTANFTLNWRPRYYLTIKPFLTAWTRSDEGPAVIGGQRDEFFGSVGLDGDWRYGKIILNLRYNHDVRGGDVANRTQDRVLLTVKRKF